MCHFEAKIEGNWFNEKLLFNSYFPTQVVRWAVKGAPKLLQAPNAYECGAPCCLLGQLKLIADCFNSVQIGTAIECLGNHLDF